MTLGEKLMQLTIEYQESTQNRTSWADYGGEPAGREPSAIGVEYEETLRRFIAN